MTEYYFAGDLWHLPDPELKQGSPLTFGEFVDSKQLIKDATEAGQSKWECLLPLAAIYLRQPGEPYEEEFLFEGSERLTLMESLPLDIAQEVGEFFEQFSEFVLDCFPVFWPSKGDKTNSRHTAKHFERYGWINFLKSIAKEKVFDIPGSNCNSIECARQARLFDVLIYASEEKEYNEAANADLKAMYDKNKG